MIDIWLIFNLLLPFIAVLLHTYMDLLRNDDEREINHHGAVVTPGKPEDSNVILTRVSPEPVPVETTTRASDLVSRKEDVQVAALKDHYHTLKRNRTEENKQKKLRICMKFARMYNPACAVIFVCIYWFVGLRQAEFF